MRERGFTLLEVMIALGILAISLVVLLGLRNRDIALRDHARSITQATLLARQELFDVTPGEAVGITEGDFAPEHPEFSWRRTVNTFMPEFFGDRVREVHVVVMWDGDRVEATRFMEARQ